MDSIIKSFLKEFATKEDISQLIKKVEGLEQILAGAKETVPRSGKKRTMNLPASEIVLDAISGIEYGATFSGIQEKTKFEAKKLRNIIYRLSKLGKIQRAKRGVYVLMEN